MKLSHQQRALPAALQLPRTSLHHSGLPSPSPIHAHSLRAPHACMKLSHQQFTYHRLCQPASLHHGYPPPRRDINNNSIPSCPCAVRSTGMLGWQSRPQPGHLHFANPTLASVEFRFREISVSSCDAENLEISRNDTCQITSCITSISCGRMAVRSPRAKRSRSSPVRAEARSANNPCRVPTTTTVALKTLHKYSHPQI